MKKFNVQLIIFTVVVFAACSANKTRQAKSIETPPVATVKPAIKNGTHAPGIEEVNAIQSKFPGVTLEKLTAGYKIYTEGACTKCHNTNNIYKYSAAAWTNILEDMSEKAKLTDSEKDAVSKYVMSIKAMQPM
jgi:hypothetical protein